ncbi:sucrose-6-phosphate hydrolase [Halobacillus sp. Marseille-Q1614]|uniref:glycoside hydrolase family 32 protein n=1 Tax=Halobacillus sp. Marseille-Q1614 TaxID=2709134 RepID=UPI00156EBB56|nr:sucrose-6-phosphate hydrolase [Halobacillus sp. Marseille-Q1614]
MTSKDAQLRQQVKEEILKHGEKVNSDSYRLAFHLMPPIGLLNDPNGLIHWKGEYHIFYQWMPFKTDHGTKFWGHYITDDFVNYRHERIALTPSEWFDKDGCYSGSAIVHEDTLCLFYTGNVILENGQQEEYQCMATSTDGLHFKKEGPILSIPEGYQIADFRDPKVWKKDDAWYMVVGAKTDKDEGKVLLFKSGSLTEWEYLGPVAGSKENGLKEFGYMWECPDLFHLEGEDILIVSPQGLKAEGMNYANTYQSGYFTGKLKEQEGRFDHGSFKELDRGFEFYAPQTFKDENGRRILFGWMGVPEQFEQSHPTIENRWIHGLTIPRELKWNGSQLIQEPVQELALMREAVLLHSEISIENDQKAVRGISGRPVELHLELEELNDQFAIEFFHYASLSFTKKDSILTLSRPHLEDKSKTEFRRVRLKNGLWSLRIFIDTSSLEIFVNDGEEVFTSRIYPDLNDPDILFTSLGQTVFSIEQWRLKGYQIESIGDA